MHTIPLSFGIVTDISPDIRLVLGNSGHMIGSASIHLHIGMAITILFIREI